MANNEPFRANRSAWPDASHGRPGALAPPVRSAEMSWRQLLAEQERLSHYRSVTSRQWLGLCLYYQGQRQEARALFQETLHEAVTHNYGRYILFNQIRLAAVELDEKNADRAKQALEQSVRRARHYNDREQLAHALRLTSRLCTMQGNAPAAKAALAEALDLFERIGIRRELAEAREELRRLEELGEAPAS
jgi:tetratricopeptide (TPR) repeat protein